MSLKRIVWAITNKCNFSCSFCYAYSNPKNPIGLATTDLLNIAAQINASTIKHVSIIGGEALMRDDCSNVIMALNPDITVNLDTNGSLVTKKWDERLTKRVHHVSIGVDGPKDLNEIFRKSTGDVEAGIKYLVERGVRVVTPVLIHKANYRHISEIVDHLLNLGVEQIQLNKCMPILGKNLSRLLLSKDEEDAALSIIEELTANERYFSKVKTSKWYNKKQMTKKQTSLSSCFCGLWSAAISSRGEFVPCLELCQTSYLSRFADRFDVPNLCEIDLTTAYQQSSLFEAFRSATLGVLPGRCGTCAFANSCSHGCRAEAFVRSGALDAQYPYCSIN